MAISDYSTTAASNTAISGTNVNEGCPPANINDAIRQLMADIATAIGGLTASSDELNLMDGFTAVETAVTDALDKFPNSRAVYRGRGWSYSSPQATTSGTAFDFTGIPDWATEIKIVFTGVSLSSTGDVIVQIGDSGGAEATGYNATSMSLTGSNTPVDYTTGFGIACSNAAVSLVGEMILTRTSASGLTWSASHIMKRAGSTIVLGGGDKAVSATLDRVRITRIGSDTFDAGAVVVLWK